MLNVTKIASRDQKYYRSSLSISSSRSKSKISICPAHFKNLDRYTPDKIAVAINIIKADNFFIWILL